MTETLPEPASREEQFLAKAAGMQGVELPTPASREELYLNAIAQGGGGGGGGDYVEKVGDTSEYPFDDQKPYLVVDDHLAYDAESINVGQLVYDTNESKFFVYAGTDIDPDTGDEYIIWDEVGGAALQQTTGTDVSSAMSQYATTKMIYPHNDTKRVAIGNTEGDTTISGMSINGNLTTFNGQGSIAIGVGSSRASVGSRGDARNSIAIGNSASSATGLYNIVLGYNSYVDSSTAGCNVAIGYNSYTSGNTLKNSVALGAYSSISRIGEVNVGAGNSGQGFNSTNYRVIGGVHDGQDSHDAVTVGQINNLIDAINSATGKNISHIGS